MLIYEIFKILQEQLSDYGLNQIIPVFSTEYF